MSLQRLIVVFIAATIIQIAAAIEWDPQEFSTDNSCAVVYPDQTVNMTWVTI